MISLFTSMPYTPAVKSPRHTLILRLAVLALWLVAAATPVFAADSLHWDALRGRVDADIRSWELRQLLDSIAAQSGWEVWAQPDAKQPVSAKFTNLSPGEALKKLLTELNFAVITPTNSAPRLYVFKTKRDEATQKIAAPVIRKQSQALGNEVVAQLKSGTDAKKIADALDGRIKGKIGNAYRLVFDSAADAKAARQSLAGMDEVLSLDSNYPIDRPRISEFPAPAAPLPFSLRPTLGPDGGMVIVGLIDTAVQRDGTALGNFLLTPITVAGNAEISQTQPMHSTSMAESILRSIAANQSTTATPVRILPVDVYGNSQTTTTFEIADGISQAVIKGARIINLSLGGEGDSALLHTIIRNSVAQGVVFFAAAGNTPTTAPFYPAAYPEVTAVTAIERNGSLADYANRGAFVDVATSGTSLVQFNSQGWVVTGTSSSAAAATGYAASLVANAGKTATEAQALVRARWSARSLVGSSGQN